MNFYAAELERVITTILFLLQPFPVIADYGITVEIPTHSPVEFHRTYHTVTLTCRTALNRTLENGLSLRTGWAKDSAFLLNSTRYRVSESVSAVSDNSGRPVTHYESNLTIHVLKPIDNGTYICSSAVVSDSSGQLLTEAFSSSVDIDVVGECVG